MEYLKSLFGRSKKNKKEDNTELVANSRFKFYNVGFHGDEYLLKVVDTLAPKSKYFIETGANVGTTLAYFARKFPEIKCLSCEPDLEAFNHAAKNADFKNVHLFNETSQVFNKRLHNSFSDSYGQPALFWLDAHGYGFEWPLIEEMVFILENYKTFYILIDDFEVPGIKEFGFDVYQNQICSHDYLKKHLPKREFYLYYPTYKEKTSKHHPLQGWGLYSSEKINWSKFGINFIREEHYNI